MPHSHAARSFELCKCLFQAIVAGRGSCRLEPAGLQRVAFPSTMSLKFDSESCTWTLGDDTAPAAGRIVAFRVTRGESRNRGPLLSSRSPRAEL